jgi:glycosyltransferase involved in cell wall biosynthesis
VKVSTIIPTYNRGHGLLTSIESALAQTYPDFEIIIVNDASQDETGAIAGAIDDPRVKVIEHSENRGVSAARNTGIRAAGGELVAFLDDDDLWLPAKLEKQVPLFKDKSVGMVYCGMSFVDEAGNVGSQALPSRRGDIYSSLLFKNCTAAGSVAVVRRECFDVVGLFDEDLTAFEDHDMWIRIARRYRFDFVPEALAHYAAYAHDRLNRPSRLPQMYHRFIAKYDTYDYPSPLLRRRATAYRHYVLGTMHGASGAIKQARGAYIHSLALWPLNPKTWISLAVSLGGAGAARGLARLKARALSLANRIRAAR